MVFLHSLILLQLQYFSIDRFPLTENLNVNLNPYCYWLWISFHCLSTFAFLNSFTKLYFYSTCSLYGVNSTIKPSHHPYFLYIRLDTASANLESICLSTIRPTPSN